MVQRANSSSKSTSSRDCSPKPPFTVAQFEAIKQIVGDAIKANAADRPLPDNAEPATKAKASPSLLWEVVMAFANIPGSMYKGLKDLAKHEFNRVKNGFMNIEGIAFPLYLCATLVFLISSLLWVSLLFPLWFLWVIFGYPVCYGVVNYLIKKYEDS